MGRIMMNTLKNKYDLEKGYNLGAAKRIEPRIGDIPVSVVGGLRTVSLMEDVLESGDADFISMSRPFIRETFAVKKTREGKTKQVSCVSCNEF